jgi:hypothetical protein
MNMLWQLILAQVHAAEELFTDPKTGPEKKAWVKAAIMTAIASIKIPVFMKPVVAYIVDFLIEAAVSVLKKQVDDYHKDHPEEIPA